MNLLRHFFRRRYLSDTGLPVGDPETGSEDVRTRELTERRQHDNHDCCALDCVDWRGRCRGCGAAQR